GGHLTTRESRLGYRRVSRRKNRSRLATPRLTRSQSRQKIVESIGHRLARLSGRVGLDAALKHFALALDRLIGADKAAIQLEVLYRAVHLTSVISEDYRGAMRAEF